MNVDVKREGVRVGVAGGAAPREAGEGSGNHVAPPLYFFPVLYLKAPCLRPRDPLVTIHLGERHKDTPGPEEQRLDHHPDSVPDS